MKQFLTIFFVTLGVVFFCLIIAGVYVYLADPFNLKPLLSGDYATPVATSTAAATDPQQTKDAHPGISAGQEQALEAVGIDPAVLPTEVTPALEACFVDVLGQARVDEIAAGSIPTPFEIARVSRCLE